MGPSQRLDQLPLVAKDNSLIGIRMTRTQPPYGCTPQRLPRRKPDWPSLCDLHGEQRRMVLYAVTVPGRAKPTHLLSASARLTVAEQRWMTEQGASVTRLGRF